MVQKILEIITKTWFGNYKPGPHNYEDELKLVLRCWIGTSLNFIINVCMIGVISANSSSTTTFGRTAQNEKGLRTLDEHHRQWFAIMAQPDAYLLQRMVLQWWNNETDSGKLASAWVSILLCCFIGWTQKLIFFRAMEFQIRPDEFTMVGVESLSKMEHLQYLYMYMSVYYSVYPQISGVELLVHAAGRVPNLVEFDFYTELPCLAKQDTGHFDELYGELYPNKNITIRQKIE